MSTSHTTSDHRNMKQWVERRGGRPAVVKGTEDSESRFFKFVKRED